MTNSKLRNIEAIGIILIVFINHIILNMPQVILSTCGTSSILNVVYITLITFLVGFILIKLFKPFSNYDIIDICDYLGGKTLKIVIGILCIIYSIIVSSTILRHFTEILKLNYYSNFSIFFLVFLFLVAPAMANMFGNKAIIKSNLIIVIISLIGLCLVFLSSAPNFVLQRALPLLGNGINETFFLGISNIFAFNGLFFLFFLGSALEKKESFNKITYISIGIIGLFLLLAITSLLLSFPFIFSTQELSPVNFMVKNIEYGTFFERPEALFIFIWILAQISYISVVLMVILLIFKKISNIKQPANLSLAFSSFILFAAMIPLDMADIRFFEDILYKNISLIFIFVILFGILIFANIKYKLNKNKHINVEVNSNEQLLQ